MSRSAPDKWPTSSRRAEKSGISTRLLTPRRTRSADAASRRIAQHLVDSRDVHVSSTTVDGNFMIRLAFLSQRTHHDVAARAVELVREAVAP